MELNISSTLFSVAQVAELFGVSHDTVRTWIAVGKIDAIRLGPNGPWRIREQDLEKAVVTN